MKKRRITLKKGGVHTTSRAPAKSAPEDVIVYQDLE